MSVSLDGMISSLQLLHAERRATERVVEDLKKQITDLENDIRDAMDAQGLIESKSAVGKVTLSSSVYPKTEDWDKFAEFIYENRYIHLLERRPAVLAYRELLLMGREVPGVLPYTKRKVTFKEN